MNNDSVGNQMGNLQHKLKQGNGRMGKERSMVIVGQEIQGLGGVQTEGAHNSHGDDVGNRKYNR